MPHTPGPWRIGRNYGAVVSDHPIESGIRGSDDVDGYGGHLIGESISQCNLAIIAAAPEMLAALKKLRKSDFAECDEPTWREIQAAIAKAEGMAI